MASIFAQQLVASQDKSVETKDQKGTGSNRETYFTAPKNSKGEPYEFLKLQEGLNVIDILPFTYQGGILYDVPAGKFDYKLDVQVHKNIGASGSDVLSLASLGLPDPLQEELANLYTAQKSLTSQEDKDKLYNDKIKPLKPKRRCIYIVLHTVDGKRIPKLFESAHFSFERLIAEKLEEEKALGMPPRIFADPLAGCSIAIMGKKDTFSGHEFIKISSISFLDRKAPVAKTEEQAVKLVEGLPKLDSLLNVKSYDEVSTLFYGGHSTTQTNVEEEQEESLSFSNTPEEVVTSDAPALEVPDTNNDEDDFNEEELVF